MGELSTLWVLLTLLGLIGAWLKLSRAREQAVDEARRQCERHGVQLLDETVGLRRLRMRRIDGRLGVERTYVFEVSIDGDDREPGRLSLMEHRLTGLQLPTIELQMPAAVPTDGNVVPLRPRNRTLH